MNQTEDCTKNFSTRSVIWRKMNIWLFKSDPEAYSWADLKTRRSEIWDGVKNPLALKYLRQIQTGDTVLIYHSGAEKSIVGVAQAVSRAVPDPNAEEGRLYVIEIKAVKDYRPAVSLALIKQEKRLSDWALVRMPRLSVMPVSAEVWKVLEELQKRCAKEGKL